ncbi:MAG: (2Fe-2S)-binding protein [Acidobacteriota bacterium]|nr:(2Fe-2S)-binding protein [Acidobacteriota bacterium]
MTDDQPAPRAEARITLRLNGEPTRVTFAAYKTLLEVLREDLGLPGTKHGCELGECGACAVLIDGQPVLSCLVLGVECDGRAVTTVEGLTRDGRLDALQEAFADLGGAQCGYCTPGILLTARALLDRVGTPTREQIREALSGNLCRCTGYQQIFEAVEAAIQGAPESGNVVNRRIRIVSDGKRGGDRLRADGASASAAEARRDPDRAEARAPGALKNVEARHE